MGNIDIQKVKDYMKANKITYPMLSEMTGLSLSCITKIFAGYAKYPRVDTWNIILNALGLDNDKNPPDRELSEGEKQLIEWIGDLSDEEWEEIKDFIQYIKSKRK